MIEDEDVINAAVQRGRELQQRSTDALEGREEVRVRIERLGETGVSSRSTFSAYADDPQAMTALRKAVEDQLR